MAALTNDRGEKLVADAARALAALSQEEPAVGRIVHFVEPGGKCRAALVTEVHHETASSRVLTGRDPETTVSLHVFEPNGSSTHRLIRYNSTNAVGTFHWPERVRRV